MLRRHFYQYLEKYLHKNAENVILVYSANMGKMAANNFEMGYSGLIYWRWPPWPHAAWGTGYDEMDERIVSNSF